MEGKARLIMAATMSSMMVFMVTLIGTIVHLGFVADVRYEWAEAYVVSYPIAAGTAYLVMPMARRFTSRTVNLINGAA